LKLLVEQIHSDCWNKKSLKIVDLSIKWATNTWFCGSWNKCSSPIWNHSSMYVHYYKMWVQFTSLRSLGQWIHYFPTMSCSLWPVNSLNIQPNHLRYMDLLLLWLLFQNHFYQPNGLIKSKVVILDLNAKFEWTTTSMSPTQHVPKLRLFCAFSLGLFWNWKVPSKKSKVKVLHLHHVMVSISIIFLWNTIIFEFVPTYGKKRVEKCRCQVLDRGWILGIYLPFVGLQDIWDNDQNV
jgi:hypothetical protein